MTFKQLLLSLACVGLLSPASALAQDASCSAAQSHSGRTLSSRPVPIAASCPGQKTYGASKDEGRGTATARIHIGVVPAPDPLGRQADWGLLCEPYFAQIVNSQEFRNAAMRAEDEAFYSCEAKYLASQGKNHCSGKYDYFCSEPTQCKRVRLNDEFCTEPHSYIDGIIRESVVQIDSYTIDLTCEIDIGAVSTYFIRDSCMGCPK